MLKKNQSFTCLAGKKIRKSAPILSVLGDLDELMAFLGAAKVFSPQKSLKKELENLQKDLVFLGGVLSGMERKKIDWQKKTKTVGVKIKKIENQRQKSFLLPGKSQASVFLHLSRVAVRRLERKVISLKKEEFQPLVGYLNRLSLYLFWLAARQEK